MNEIKLPQLGQSVEEASIIAWFKKEGDTVSEGEPIFNVQTDKAEIEVESTASGVLRKILVQPDELVPVMTVVALVGAADEALPDLSVYGGASAGSAAPAATPVQAAPEAPAAVHRAPAPAIAAKSGGPVSPRARKKAAALGVDPAHAAGSGVGGRVMESDVTAFAEEMASLPANPTARRLAGQEGIDLRQVQGTGPRGRITKEDVIAAADGAAPAPQPAGAGVRRVPLTPMRRIIAQRMAESLYTAPHYYVTVELDMTNAVKLRGASKGFKPSYNDIVVHACARALGEFPAVNARWAGDAIDEVAAINIGFAVALPTGLIVPVVRNAERLSLQGVNEACAGLVEKARKNKLTPDDYSGNTFTVSNLGVFGVDSFTAIINQPDSAILAVGQMKDQAVVIDGGIHIRPMMKMTLSSDHRVIDGALAAQFMGRLKALLEEAAF